jgi:hypothetical protein
MLGVLVEHGLLTGKTVGTVASIATHRERTEATDTDALVPVERGYHRAEDGRHDEIRFGDADLAPLGKAADQTGTGP